jgi:hypothetical protein
MNAKAHRLVAVSITALILTASTFIAGAGSASASPTPETGTSPGTQPGAKEYNWTNSAIAPTREQLQRGIDDVIARTPGARQIDRTTVEVAPGLLMRFRSLEAESDSKAESPSSPFASCNILYLCVYVDRQYGGAELVFTVCGREWNLGNVAFPGGGYWNDRISSITNQQSSGTTSYFYNYNGSGSWSRIVTVAAGNYRSNLALDTREDGGPGSPNDMIDGVHVCGAVPSPWKPNWP